ncbi:S8 family peptidase [Allorhizocola rhizosphaerae]|uniref:S8 family peptidase n=1 Tax=Allorhizocola rhizosphaerae TaxID=1872709 RepID=UPI000E3E0E5E|nr:S8 family serine peptidase [Allorhizocola rhizosphaerae]
MRAVLSVVVAGLVTLQPSPQPDLVRGLQWHIGTMRLGEVHGRATGAGMVIAVVDSGVDPQHPDLLGQVLQGPDPKANTDTDGRGTGLAGLIAGHGHSNTALSGVDPGEAGVLGVAPGAKLLPIAFAPVAGQVGDPNELATGIELAVNRGARIICIGRGVAPSERLEFAINVAVEKDVLVVAADSSTWPASYPGVLTSIPADRTGAVRQAPASGRTTGIVVPGVDMITTDRAGGYRLADPSAGAAILTGAAAVVWSANPNAKASEVVELLRRTAKDRGTPGADKDFGVGDLNLLAALNAASVRPSGSVSPQPRATPSKRPADTAAAGTPLAESGDWRRWMVALPLLLFLGALGFWVGRTGRARRALPRP